MFIKIRLRNIFGTINYLLNLVIKPNFYTLIKKIKENTVINVEGIKVIKMNNNVKCTLNLDLNFL